MIEILNYPHQYLGKQNDILKIKVPSYRVDVQENDIAEILLSMDLMKRLFRRN